MGEKLKRIQINRAGEDVYELNYEPKSYIPLHIPPLGEFLGGETKEMTALKYALHVIRGGSVGHEFFDNIEGIVVESSNYKTVLTLDNNNIDCEAVKKNGKSIYFSGFDNSSWTCKYPFYTVVDIDRGYSDFVAGSIYRPQIGPISELDDILLYLSNRISMEAFFKKFSDIAKACGFNDISSVQGHNSWNSVFCLSLGGKVAFGLDQMGNGFKDLFSLYTYYKYCEVNRGGVLVTPSLGNFHPNLYKSIEDFLKNQDKVQVITYERY